MNKSFTIAQLPPDRLDDALSLAHTVFMEFVAPDFSPAGIEEFLRFIDKTRLREQMTSSEVILWACFAGRKMAGILGMEARGHICLLFVAAEFHRQGIAKAMLQKGLAYFRKKNINRITVNSSPYAVRAYQRLGFVATQEEQCFKGLRFIPMLLEFV